ncbi:hypothetical protein [Lysinibacillus sp. NPDC093692]|uniref:hypothetical protein n=1 Tax=Lysinibacillus sp. NPDC093692 TaxID=3390578 RepID=UPI003D01F4D5
MPQYTKGNHVINATVKAYEVLYAARGYIPCEELEDLELYGLSYEELDALPNETLKKFLDQEKIEYKSRATKKELIALVLGDEGIVNGTDGIEDTHSND